MKILKMAPIDRLKEQGWYLSIEGLENVSERGTITDVKKIVRNALDLDLKEISCGSFPEEINKGKLNSIPGKIVVQVQKVRNVSAPKANEESRAAPRMLKLWLTDGVSVCPALEFHHIPGLSVNTAPGTKLFLKSDAVKLIHGIIELNSASVEVLGGKVTAMLEKWELNRTLAKHTRGRVGEEGGPPPWIPFGQKIIRSNPQDRNFKSLETPKDKENRENAEFEAQRKDAIAEAAKGSGTKKVFGGGQKQKVQLLEHNVQQIVDYGFTSDQAEYALRLSRNNVGGALRNLQRQDYRDRTKVNEPRGGREEPREERRERRKRGDRGKTEEEGATAPKPSARVSLFDFLEDKLPVQNEKESERGYGGAHAKYGDSNRPARPGNTAGRSVMACPNRGRANTSAWPDRDSKPTTYNTRQNNSQAAPVYQQKPPRFQNQHRYQHSQENSWSPAFSDTGFTTSNWNAPPPSTKDRENQFPMSRESFANANYESSDGNLKNFLFDVQKNLDQFSTSANGRIDSFAPSVVDLSSKLSNHHIGINYQKSTNPPVTQNSMFPLDFGFKGHVGSFGGVYDNFGLSTTDSYVQKPWVWHKGDKCMAKYWEDNMYYNAEVTGVSQRTCVVRFLEYGNHEEVLQDDCIPFSEERVRTQTLPSSEGLFNAADTNSHHQTTFNQNHFSG